MTSENLFQNTFVSGRSGVAISTDIIKIITRFIQRTFKDSRKVKRTWNYVPPTVQSTYLPT